MGQHKNPIILDISLRIVNDREAEARPPGNNKQEVDKPDAKSYFSGKTEPYYSEYLLSSTNLQIERKRLINRAF